MTGFVDSNLKLPLTLAISVFMSSGELSKKEVLQPLGDHHSDEHEMRKFARDVKLCQIRHQVFRYIQMFISYKSYHIVASLLFFVIRMATPPGLFERPIIIMQE